MHEHHQQQAIRQQRLAREKTAYQYTTALERGDIETLAEVLHQAEQDRILEQIILEVHNAYQDEDHTAVHPDEAISVHDLLLTDLILPSTTFRENEPIPTGPSTRSSRFGARIQTLAAVLVVAVLVGGFLVLFASRHIQPGGSGLHSNNSGGSWRVVESPNPAFQNILNGVVAISSSDAWAVGNFSSKNSNKEQTITIHWNGTQWSVIPSPNPGAAQNELKALAAISANDVWAAGYYSDNCCSNAGKTLIEHWNGTEWNIVKSPNSRAISNILSGVVAISANDVWAVGSSSNSSSNVVQALIEHWNGSRWSIVPSPNPGASISFLNGVAAISANDIWAVGYSADSSYHTSQTLIEHWNGSQWSIVKSPNPGLARNTLSGVVAISASDIWAVGSTADSQEVQTLAEHWNGSQWRAVKSSAPRPTLIGLLGVTAFSASNVWAVGISVNSNQVYQTFIEHWDGTRWSGVSSPNPGSTINWLLGLDRIPNSGKIWAVGFSRTGNSVNDVTQTLIELYTP